MGDPRLNFKDVCLACVLFGFVVPATEVISSGMLCHVVFLDSYQHFRGVCILLVKGRRVS